MAAKKKTTKKASAKGAAKGGTATLEPGKTAEQQVEMLPKGQVRGKDGTIILKSGEHLGLEKSTYEVHGSRLELEGDVFVADYDVNWLPVKQCVCKKDRPDPTEIRKLPDGKFAVMATCQNKECALRGKTYLWVMPSDRFRL